MSGIEQNAGFDLSLAQLAEMNTDEIAVLTSRVPDIGVYIVNCLEVKGSQADPKPNEPTLFSFTWKHQILEATLLDKTKDTSGIIGKNLNDRFTLWPKDFKEMMGLLKGRYKLVGLPYEGMPLGGVENAKPGWLDTAVGHIFQVKVRHWTNKSGEVQAAMDWLAYKSPEQIEAEKNAA